MYQSICRIAFLVLPLFIINAIISGCSRENNNKTSATSTISGQKLNEGNSKSPAAIGVVDVSTVLATVENLPVLQLENQSHATQNFIAFSVLGRGAAYISEQSGRQRVVHNGKPGNLYSVIEHLTVSPDGQRVSYRCALSNKQQIVSDGKALFAYDNVRSLLYSPDSRHFSYLADIGGQLRIVLDEKIIDENSVVGHASFTNDSAKYIYTVSGKEAQLGKLVILDLKSGNKISKDCLGASIAVNRDTERIAAPVKDGDKQLVIDFLISSPNDIHKSELYDSVSDIAIGSDGKTVAFIGDKHNHRYLVLNGKEEILPDELAVTASPVIRPDLKGAAVILSTKERFNRQFILHQAFIKDSQQHIRYEKMQDLVYSKFDNTSAFVAKKGEKYLVVVNGKEGPEFDMVVSPMFSPDGRKLVYRARNGNVRFAVVADVAGKEHRRSPEFEYVFPTVFTADGAYVAYGVKTGNQIIWNVDKL